MTTDDLIFDQYPGQLHRRQIDSYDKSGYFIENGLFSPAQVAHMAREAESIVRGDYGRLYDGAISMEQASNAVRKVVAVVERSQIFRQYCTCQPLVGALQDVLGKDILLLRDIVMFKPAYVGSSMNWHRDVDQWSVNPQDVCTIWVALDKAEVSNGCMKVISGSHRTPLSSNGGRNSLNGDGVDSDAVTHLPMEPGSVLFMHGRLLHASGVNSSPAPRRAFIASFMSAKSTFSEASTRKRFFKIAGRTYLGFVRDCDSNW